MSTRTRSVLSTTAVSTWMGIPMLLPASALEWQARPPNLTPSILGAVLYSGIFATVIAILSWHEAMCRVRRAEASTFHKMRPVRGGLLGICILRDSGRAATTRRCACDLWQRGEHPD